MCKYENDCYPGDIHRERVWYNKFKCVCCVPNRAIKDILLTNKPSNPLTVS